MQKIVFNLTVRIIMSFITDNNLYQDFVQIIPSSGNFLAADWLNSVITTQNCKTVTQLPCFLAFANH